MFYSISFIYFKTSNQGYLIPFNSFLFHSFPLLKYISFHSIHFHSLVIMPFHSILNLHLSISLSQHSVLTCQKMKPKTHLSPKEIDHNQFLPSWLSPSSQATLSNKIIIKKSHHELTPSS